MNVFNQIISGITNLTPKLEKSMHYPGRLVDSDVPKFSAKIQYKRFCTKIFEQFAPFFSTIHVNFLGLIVPNCNILYTWASCSFSFIPILNCFERHSTRYINKHSLLVKIWQRLSQNDRLPALVCLGPHAFGFSAVAWVVRCRVYGFNYCKRG